MIPMTKFSINLMFLLSFFIISNAYAGNPNDVKKIDAFLKKEAPGVPVAPLDLAQEDMRAYDFINPKGGGKNLTAPIWKG